MSRISEAFKNNKVFIPFITGGDPDIETTRKILYVLNEAGAGIIEIGIPFSDPIAEGPVIQEASQRALEAGTTTDSLFELVKEVRADIKIPILFMTYANVVFKYGADKFADRCNECGIDGMIIPDIPYEEKAEFTDICKAHDISFISMIAPTSKDRVQMIAKEAEGFIYCVSSMGVTGVRSDFSNNLDEMIKSVREVTDVPVAIGFGISTPEQAAKMAALSDGAIVGSAIVRIIAEHGTNAPAAVKEYVTKMVQAIK